MTQPLMITLGSVLTERSLGLNQTLSNYFGFKNEPKFGRFLMCIAIHQIIRNKILVRMTKSIYNHLNYSSFNELDKINQSLYKSMAWKYLNLGVNSLLYPSIFYLIHRGFLDYGVWRSLSLRVIATRFCVSAVATTWNNVTALIRDLYDVATYFPIPDKSGKYLILIPENDVLYGTHFSLIKKTTVRSYFKAMQKAVQPYSWMSVHSQRNYCKCIDRISALTDYETMSLSRPGSPRRRSSVQMQQQIIAEVSVMGTLSELSQQ